MSFSFKAFNPYSYNVSDNVCIKQFFWKFQNGLIKILECKTNYLIYQERFSSRKNSPVLYYSVMRKIYLNFSAPYDNVKHKINLQKKRKASEGCSLFASILKTHVPRDSNANVMVLFIKCALLTPVRHRRAFVPTHLTLLLPLHLFVAVPSFVPANSAHKTHCLLLLFLLCCVGE